jgi:hypothetical protein
VVTYFESALWLNSRNEEKLVQNTFQAPNREEVASAEKGQQVTLRGIPRSLQKKYGVDSDVKATYTSSSDTVSGKCFIAKNRRGKKVSIDPSDFPKGSVQVEFEAVKVKPVSLLA